MSLFRQPIRFDDAREAAFELAGKIAQQGFDVLVVRDVLGRFTLLVDDLEGRSSPSGDVVTAWNAELTDRLAVYCSTQGVVQATGMLAASAILGSPRVVRWPGSPASGGSIRFLDNTVVGEDWGRVSPARNGTTYRTALYGFKGGVGRTTATAMLARHLADLGHRVLVVDLDLESPGIGPLLAATSRHGVVDQLVEAAVGNVDGLEIVHQVDYTPKSRDGELWVAPARGQQVDATKSYTYADKLNRIYAGGAGESFADRLEAAVQACEDEFARRGDSGEPPDVVLLDSRAGIHDVAAVAISRLCDRALLFAADNAQTWDGYGDLFAAWQSSGQATAIRKKLRMVASMVPDSVHFSQEKYLASFTSRSFGCFAALYDEVPAGAVADPTETDSDAPHSPIPILFEPGLVGMDAGNAPGWQDRAFVQAAYGGFLKMVTPLVIPGSGKERND